jgi:hypothetical protein
VGRGFRRERVTSGPRNWWFLGREEPTATGLRCKMNHCRNLATTEVRLKDGSPIVRLCDSHLDDFRSALRDRGYDPDDYTHGPFKEP